MLVDKAKCVMVYIMHDSKRTADYPRRRPQEASGRGQAYGEGITLSGVDCTEEGPADLILHSAGYRDGDREVREVIRWRAGLPVVISNKQALTSLPTTEEDVAKAILSASHLHFTYASRRPGGEGR